MMIGPGAVLFKQILANIVNTPPNLAPHPLLPDEEVLGELMPADQQLYQDYLETMRSAHRHAVELSRAMNKMDATSYLFWDRVHERYEGVKLARIKDADMMGLMIRCREDGELVFVKHKGG